jgi:Holliday junction resolvase
MKSLIKAYRKGANLEREVKDMLIKRGFETYRVRGSKEVDLISFKKDNYFRAIKIEVKAWSSFTRLSKEELNFIKRIFFDAPPEFYLITKKEKDEWCLFFSEKFKIQCVPFEEKADFSRCAKCILPFRHKEIFFERRVGTKKGGEKQCKNLIKQ